MDERFECIVLNHFRPIRQFEMKPARLDHVQLDVEITRRRIPRPCRKNDAVKTEQASTCSDVCHAAVKVAKRVITTTFENPYADAVDQLGIQAVLEKVLTGQHLAVQCHVDRSEANNLLQRLCDRSGVFTTDKDNAGTLSRPHVRWFDADAL